jgi:hypothetical protein
MSLLTSALARRPRFLAELTFVFAGALVMGAAGIVVAVVAPPLRPVPVVNAPFNWFMRGAIGFGLGWWGGVIWCLLLALRARRHQPPPLLPWLLHATWVGALLLAVSITAGLALGLTFLPSFLAALMIATLAARWVVSVGARRYAA